MIVFPNCKINLGLFVTEKRSDGFHNIESIFLPIEWSDVLEMNFADGREFSLESTGRTIDSPMEENIIYKAFQLMKAKYDIPNLAVHLLKQLPTGAGLGGGSSDGAFAIRAINEICQLNLEIGEMESLAAQLGSDCPFFIQNKACLVKGRGEILQPMDIDLSGYHVGLIHPGIHVSTPQAYSKIKPQPATFDLNEIMSVPVEDWKDVLRNDFETPVFNMFSIISDIKEEMYNEGAVYASMSGSGSAVYGLFEDEPDLNAIKSAFHITSAPSYTGKVLQKGK
jgi:4-diphosphocytidyl-2-C-methyl-D-erythritol kinase